jgi:colicin import membrane protein
MHLERDRLEREAESRRAEELERLRAQEEEQRRYREELEHAQRTAEARRLEEERREEEERRRLQALRVAELERARLEAENQARQEAARAYAEHEAQLNELRADRSKRKLTYIAAGIAAVLLSTIVGGALLIKGQLDEQAAAEARHAAALAEEKSRAEALQADISRLASQSSTLEEQLERAKGEREREELKQRLQQTRAELSDKRARQHRRHHGGKHAKTEKCVCPPGDPLCSCL